MRVNLRICASACGRGVCECVRVCARGPTVSHSALPVHQPPAQELRAQVKVLHGNLKLVSKELFETYDKARMKPATVPRPCRAAPMPCRANAVPRLAADKLAKSSHCDDA